jgi:FkbM family methyltransferase
MAAYVLLRRILKLNAAVNVYPRELGGRCVTLRPNESDLFVLSQIYGLKEYDIGAERRNQIKKLAKEYVYDGYLPVIVDAGANVGYSSIFFSEVYPQALVLAVEPDTATFAVLVQNCSGYSRIRPINAALWSHDRGVKLIGAEQASWSRLVGEASGANTIPSIRLDQLLSDISNSRLLILKLDIEGAEREVCKSSPHVIRAAPCVLVEPHDFKMPGAACLAPLFSAIAGKEVDTILIGENILVFDSAIYQI